MPDSLGRPRRGAALALLWQCGLAAAIRPSHQSTATVIERAAALQSAANRSAGVRRSLSSSQAPCLHVITYDRPESLERLLTQLNRLDYGADSGHVRLSIAIDYPYHAEKPHTLKQIERTVALAENFEFEHGQKVVRALSSHAGLVKQWVEAWTPDEDDDERPACMILEDDVLPSTMAWTWMREALAAYGDKTDRIASFGLNRPTTVAANYSSRGLGKMPPDGVGQPFLSRYFSTWGFVAVRDRWIGFRRYMADNYVEGHPAELLFEGRPLKPSLWHHSRPHQMWSYWFVRFMQDEDLFTLYSNLGDQLSLCVNFFEKGLHFDHNRVDPARLLETDTETLHNFPALRELSWYDWDAQPAQLGFPL